MAHLSFRRLIGMALGSDQGSGNLITEERPVSDFTQLVFSGIGDMTIEQTGTESLVIEAEDNIMPEITTTVQNHALTIGLKHHANLRPAKKIRYRLTVKDLSSIKLSGVGNVTVPQFDTRDLALTVSGAGNSDMRQVTVTTLSVTLSGAGSLSVAGIAHTVTTMLSGTGTLTLSGTTHEQSVALSGAGSYHGDDLASDRATVRVSGVGKATVRVSGELDATVSGVGSIRYIGNPLLSKRVTGVGSISQKIG